jgi:hypothetical protein
MEDGVSVLGAGGGGAWIAQRAVVRLVSETIKMPKKHRIARPEYASKHREYKPDNANSILD